MGLVTRYQTQEEVPEDLRDDFVEDTVSEKNKGTWVHRDILALEEGIRKERNDQKASKATVSQLKNDLTERQKELEIFRQFGTPDEIQSMKKKIEELAPPPKIEELRTQLTTTTQKLREEQAWRTQNEKLLKELQENDAKYKREMDEQSARNTIRENIKGMNGQVNERVLEDVLFLKYRTGELKRNDADEIVNANGETLGNIIPKYARESGLYKESVSGGIKPPQTPPARGANKLLELQNKLKEAKQSGDVGTVLAVTTEISQLEQ